MPTLVAKVESMHDTKKIDVDAEKEALREEGTNNATCTYSDVCVPPKCTRPAGSSVSERAIV